MEGSHVIEIFYSSFESKIGRIFIAATKNGLCRLCLCNKENIFLKELKNGLKGEIEFNKSFTHLEQYINILRSYFQKKEKNLHLPVEFLFGTKFQKKVWMALRKIPYGESRSYNFIARSISKNRASRAVGNAVGSNPIPIIIPCHRVIRKNGNLGGFALGIEIKKKLLKVESQL